MNITRILCPTDFSEASAHAIDLAVVLAAAYRARIAAVHVALPAVVPFEIGTPSGVSLDGAEIDALVAKTTALFSTASRTGIDLDVFVDRGFPADRILHRAASLPADVVVMGTHGSRGFERLVLGSRRAVRC